MSSHENRSRERCRSRSAKRFFVTRSLRRSFAATTILAGCLAAGTALADEGSVDLVNVLSKTIEIESDGQHYTKPANPLLFIAADVHVALDAQVSGRIKSYKVWLKFRAETSDWLSFPQYGYSQSFPLGDRPKSLGKTVQVGVPSAAYGSHLVDYCEQQAADLRQGGLSDQAIFAQDRPLEVGLNPALQYDMNGIGGGYDASGLGGGWDVLKKMTVVCKASKSNPQRLPTADNGPTRKDPVLESLSLLVIEKGSLSGACSLQLAGTVKTKEPNTEAKFRFESDDGRKSDVKTVTTGSVATRQYAYDYPLSPGGTKTGKIRVVAVGENVASDWKDYEVNCGSSAQDVATLLPPKAIDVEIIPTGEEIVHRGYACPATAKIYGVLKGRGKSKGGAALFAGGKLNTLAQYDVQDDESVVIQGDYTFDWANTQSAQQNVKSVFRITNLSQDVVDEIENTQNFTCRKIETSPVAQGAAGGYAADVDLPKSVGLFVSPLGQKRIPGYSCPAKARVHGAVQSDDTPLTGSVGLFVNGSLVKQLPVDLPAKTSHNYDTDYELAWNASTQTEQTLNFTLKFANQHGYVVKTLEKQESFACQTIETSGVAQGGGLTNGAAQPSQQARPSAPGRLVLGPTLVIQAPKGTVKQGVIQLSGAQPAATYTLRFFRKSGGSATQVTSAQLPKAMKGASASFPLDALTGGRSWRLEVCPQGQAGASCKTADFRIAAFGLKQQKPQQKPQQKQEGTPFVIVPGVLN